jgi:hypothetical protein
VRKYTHMDQETLSFYNWQFEQEQVERIKARFEAG